MLFGTIIRAARYINVNDIVRIDKSNYKVVSTRAMHGSDTIVLEFENVLTSMPLIMQVAMTHPFNCRPKK